MLEGSEKTKVITVKRVKSLWSDCIYFQYLVLQVNYHLISLNCFSCSTGSLWWLDGCRLSSALQRSWRGNNFDPNFGRILPEKQIRRFCSGSLVPNSWSCKSGNISWAHSFNRCLSEILLLYFSRKWTNWKRISGIGFAQNKLDFILVIPPKRSQRGLFSDKEFDALYEFVTAFSLMTYDFSHPERPGISLVTH